jgi:hypothetical protein
MVMMFTSQYALEFNAQDYRDRRMRRAERQRQLADARDGHASLIARVARWIQARRRTAGVPAPAAGACAPTHQTTFP